MVRQPSGKTQLALSIQSKFPSFVVNADSMQVYDKLNILTNKPNKKDLKTVIASYLILLVIQKNVTLDYGEKDLLNC